MNRYRSVCLTALFLLLGLMRTEPAQAACSVDLEMKNGSKKQVLVVAIGDNGMHIQIAEGAQALVEWDKVLPRTEYMVREKFIENKDARGWFLLGEWALAHEMPGKAADCFEKTLKYEPKSEQAVKEKMRLVRELALRVKLDVNIKKKKLPAALTTLGKEAGVRIFLDGALEETLKKMDRNAQPTVNYETKEASLEGALVEILSANKMKYLSMPGGIIVYDPERGLGSATLQEFNKVLAEGTTKDKIEMANAVSRLGAKESVEGLKQSVTDSDPGVRLASLLALRNFHDDSVATIILGLVKSDKNEQIRNEAIEALRCRAKPDEHLKDLADLMENDTGVVAWKAAEIVGQMNAPESVKALRECLGRKKIKDGTARRKVIEALGNYSDPESVPLLRELLKDKYVHYRNPCGIALARMNVREAIPEVIAAMNEYSNDVGTVREFVDALIVYGGDEATSAVLNMIGKAPNDGEKRNLIYKLYYSLPNQLVEDAMLEYVKNGDEAMALSASRVLYSVGTNKSVEPLIAAMEKYPKKWEIIVSLRRLTGTPQIDKKNIEYEPDKWKKWWEENKLKNKVER